MHTYARAVGCWQQLCDSACILSIEAEAAGNSTSTDKTQKTQSDGCYYIVCNMPCPNGKECRFPHDASRIARLRSDAEAMLQVAKWKLLLFYCSQLELFSVLTFGRWARAYMQYDVWAFDTHGPLYSIAPGRWIRPEHSAVYRLQPTAYSPQHIANASLQPTANILEPIECGPLYRTGLRVDFFLMARCAHMPMGQWTDRPISSTTLGANGLQKNIFLWPGAVACGLWPTLCSV